MNVNCDPSRLRALWHIMLRDDVRRYGQYLLAGLGVIFAIITLNTHFQDYHVTSLPEKYIYDPVTGFESGFFVLGLFVLGCLSASYIGAPLGQKTTAISALMLPASQLEKYLMRWVIFVPGFFICYMLGICIVDFSHLLVEMMHGMPLSHIRLAIAEDPFTGCGPLFYSAFFALQSVFALGGTVWPKHGVRSTVAALFVLGILFSILQAILISVLLFSLADTSLRIVEHSFEFIAREYREWVLSAILWAMAIFNYVLAYFRVKESEIINRF